MYDVALNYEGLGNKTNKGNKEVGIRANISTEHHEEKPRSKAWSNKTNSIGQIIMTKPSFCRKHWPQLGLEPSEDSAKQIRCGIKHKLTSYEATVITMGIQEKTSSAVHIKTC